MMSSNKSTIYHAHEIFFSVKCGELCNFADVTVSPCDCKFKVAWNLLLMLYTMLPRHVLMPFRLLLILAVTFLFVLSALSEE